ncbi:class I SAM-dependent methyltransferase [Alteribacter populi]|uniref:class I SAM-dependent methyltransferase n=1 Tax=Alteribacter populi TaxID=2011011 RepID=UPI000BBA6D98|nr:class I SAM-dependent methyltransferase [Alteribacter populi]
MKPIVVTTAPKETTRMMTRAVHAQDALSAPLIKRGHASVTRIMEKYKAHVVVAEQDRLMLYTATDSAPFFYHPNSAMFRAKAFLKTGHDPFVDAAKLREGMTVADGTIGLGSDAVLASLAVKKSGKVFGTEVNPILAYMIEEGLKSYKVEPNVIENALRRIQVINEHHQAWLKKQETSSIDVVYFDPMFQETVKGSSGIQALKQLAYNDEDDILFGQTIREAKRVARQRVVLKDHFRSRRFNALGLTQQIRPSATYHFGVWEKQTNGIMD